MAKRNTYTAQFKKEAVELLRQEEKPLSQVANDLGISDSSLSRWDKELGTMGNRQRNGDAEHEELLRLRKEVRVLRMERDILKKAAAFFAKENP
jgi:transposase